MDDTRNKIRKAIPGVRLREIIEVAGEAPIKAPVRGALANIDFWALDTLPLPPIPDLIYHFE